MAEQNEVLFRITGLVVILITLFNILGAILLIYGRLKPMSVNHTKMIAAWWIIEIFSAILIMILIYRYVILNMADSLEKSSYGMSTYFMIIWFSPAIIGGLISLFLKPIPSMK